MAKLLVPRNIKFNNGYSAQYRVTLAGNISQDLCNEVLVPRNIKFNNGYSAQYRVAIVKILCDEV